MAQKKMDGASSEFSRATSRKAVSLAKKQAKKAVSSAASHTSKRRSKPNQSTDELALGLVAVTVVGAAIASLVKGIKKKN